MKKDPVPTLDRIEPILERLIEDRGGWVLTADLGSATDLYVQFLVTVDNTVVSECVSSESVPGVLDDDQNEALPLLGWEWPQSPNKPNWSVSDYKPGAAATTADRIIRTIREILKLLDDSSVQVKLFPSARNEEQAAGPYSPTDSETLSPTIEQVLQDLRAAKTERDIADATAKLPRMTFAMWRAYSRELNAAMERVDGN